MLSCWYMFPFFHSPPLHSSPFSVLLLFIFLRREVWFGSTTAPSPVSKLPLFLSLHVCRYSSLLTGETGGGGGCGADSYDRNKAWPSINRSILSVSPPPVFHLFFFFCMFPIVHSPLLYLSHSLIFHSLHAWPSISHITHIVHQDKG